MKQFLLDLFKDNSSVSMMRMLSLICVLTASMIAFYSVYAGKDLNAVSILVGVFLGSGIGGKVAQKISEVKVDK